MLDPSKSQSTLCATLNLPWERMVASCMTWFRMGRRQAEQHVENYIAQRDRERGRREARSLREQEGV